MNAINETKMGRTIDMPANTVASCDFVNAKGYITDKDIFHVTVEQGQQVTIETIELGKAFIAQFEGKKFYNIYEFKDFSDVTPEVRKWASDKNGNQYTIADAIVITSLPQKILADFYLKFNKPVKPTKIFRNKAQAFNWINQLIEDAKK